MSAWLLLMAIAAPPDVQADFTAANERALKDDLRGAIALYESLRDRGVRNADLLFNLGNAYANNDQLVEAVISYERALRLSPGDADVEANLRAIRLRLDPNHTNANQIAAPESPLTAADAFAPWAASVPSLLSALLLLLGNALFWGAWWLPERRRVTFLSVGGGLAVLGALFVIAQAVVEADPIAIIRRPTSLREGPRPQFRESGRAAAGTRVRVIDRNGTWREVQRDDGTTGWLPVSNLAQL